MSVHYISNYSAKYEDRVIFYRLGDNGLIWRSYKMVNSFTVMSGFSRVVRTFRTICHWYMVNPSRATRTPQTRGRNLRIPN